MAEEHFFYRFRTLDKIFEYKELENQEIYFSAYENLNDPMEFYQNIVFNGDRVVCHNLFKHYLMCLYLTIQEVTIREKDDISIINSPNILRTNIDKSKHLFHKQYFYKIYHELRQNQEYNNLINMLENLTITKAQLMCILLIISEFFIDFIFKYNIYSSNIKYIKNYTFLNLKSFIEQIKNNNIMHSNVLKYYEQCWIDIKQSIHEENYSFIYYNFASKYIEHLPTLITYKMGIACFTENFRNSYMWSVYADKNNGIALIYNINNKYLDLTYPNEKNFEPYGLQKVRYGEKREQINFFKYNYMTFYHSYNEFWNYDYLTKEKSQFYKKNTVPDDKIIDEYPDIIKEFNELFNFVIYDFIIKNEDWKHEQEYRILFTNQNNRKLQYNFQDLYGIIFGIGTPFDAKQKIVNIILEKCKENGRNIKNFHFFQAYFYPDKNQIEKYEIEDISIYTPYGA